MLMQPRLWVNRRVETIEFIDVARLRRHISIDFTIPQRNRIPVTLQTGQALTFVPLSLLNKRTLRNFSVRTETGRALPVLTKEQNSLIGATLLRSIGRSVIKGNLDPHIERDIDDVVGGNKAEWTRGYGNLSTPRGLGSHAQRKQLWASRSFRTLATDFAQQFVLYVPLAVVPGDRRVLKVEYEEDFHPRKLTLAERFGLRRVYFNFLAPSLGAAASYHAEVPSPDELVISSAYLYEIKPDGTKELLDKDFVTHRAHVRASDMPRGSTALLSVGFRLRRAGLPVESAVLAGATALILAGGWLLHRQDITVKRDVASLLIVALPGLYATYLVRPGEHRLVKRLVSGLKIVVLLLAALSFAAAASLAIDISDARRYQFWGFGALVAAAAGVLIVLGMCTGKVRDWWLVRQQK